MSEYNKNKPLSGLTDLEELCDEETDDILTFEHIQNENGITGKIIN